MPGGIGKILYSLIASQRGSIRISGAALHLLHGAIFLGAAAALSDIAANVQVLGLDGPTAVMVTAVLVAVASWLKAKGSDSG